MLRLDETKESAHTGVPEGVGSVLMRTSSMRLLLVAWLPLLRDAEERFAEGAAAYDGELS